MQRAQIIKKYGGLSTLNHRKRKHTHTQNTILLYTNI